MTEANKEATEQGLNVVKCLSFGDVDRDPHSKENLLDLNVLHSREGNEAFEKFLKIRTLGPMDIDTFNLREAEMKGRSKSVCAPERLREVQGLYKDRLFGYEQVWEMAREQCMPMVHSTVWGDEPASKRYVSASGERDQEDLRAKRRQREDRSDASSEAPSGDNNEV